MDSSPDFTATALFSPSKARAQQAQARDWAAVDAWLAKKYNPSSNGTNGNGSGNDNNHISSKRIPLFERNDDTLQALLTLATLNDSADEQRGHVERVEKAALQALTKSSSAGGGSVADEVLPALMSELAVGGGGGQQQLDSLAEAAVLLDVPPRPAVDVLAMGGRVTALTAKEFELRQQVERAEAQVAALKAEQKRVAGLVTELKSERFSSAAQGDVVEQTAEWVRATKQLRAKIGEYDERLAGSKAGELGAEVQGLKQKMEAVGQQKEQLAMLEAEMSAFQDLPADSRGAQAKMRQAREELRTLVEKRDRLFEGMVDEG